MSAMWWLIGAAAALASVMTVGLVQTRHIRMRTYRYVDSAVPSTFSGFRIAQISDYHDSPFSHHGKAMLTAVRAQRPDLIVLTGDLFDRRRPDGCQNTFALVKAAQEIAPVVAVEGNHELRLARYPQWRERLISLGAILLEDEALTVYRDGQAVRIVGMRQEFDAEMLLRLCRPAPWKLVLSHRCECVSQYASAGKALILTGHAHGGQIGIFGRGVYAPEQGVLPRYAAGAYRVGDAVMAVSRGIGNSIWFPRIFDMPEWNLIVLSDGTDGKGRTLCL